ncbi:hypothetical protein M231_07591 [Tremella mesenterica]|uniref:DUF2415 domain-containing protein n=1 Tax=Tremella mesenterica TaxID=5217 RepID=A0A4Q1BFQ1_TREME|nr:hypothetical protein M231_07591 [Tremella mesenterica]
MARDPPNQTPSGQLQDLNLNPTSVRQAKITIVHPQLRDLILPLEKGRVLYPRGNCVEEQRWDAGKDEDDEDGRMIGRVLGTTKTIANLTFTPNCLARSGQILAFGGQHGELHITTLPKYPPLSTQTFSSPSPGPQSPPSTKPDGAFTISLTLPTNSINNSLLLLPTYPSGWRKHRQTKWAGFVGHGSRKWDDLEESSDSESFSSRHVSGSGKDRESEEVDDDDQNAVDDTMDLDDAPSPLSVATYPNTVPFYHAARMPHLPSDRSSLGPRRASSSSSQLSFSSNRANHFRLSGLPPPQIVTSRRVSFQYPPASRPPKKDSEDPRLNPRARPRVKKEEPEEPRLLVSNNDKSIKMFSISSATTESYETTFLDSRLEAPSPNADRRRWGRADLDLYSRLGSRTIWETLGLDDAWRRWERNGPWQEEALELELQRAQEELRAESEALRRRREDFERTIGLRLGTFAGDVNEVRASARRLARLRETQRSGGVGIGGRPREDWGPDSVTEEGGKRLNKIGWTGFKCPINHSSISPDLSTLVSVGDSTEINLFQVIDGGREFKKIAVYNAATDAHFSSAWSKDGRKFAVASQDGQVTVYDHRSSLPLAKFFSTPTTPSSPSSPSFMSDLQSPAPLLIDPMTGDPRAGGSTSGRPASRVVKFSPEGSSRDILAFSQEDSYIHLIDARTLNVHLVLPIPREAPSFFTNPSPSSSEETVTNANFPYSSNSLTSHTTSSHPPPTSSGIGGRVDDDAEVRTTENSEVIGDEGRIREDMVGGVRLERSERRQIQSSSWERERRFRSGMFCRGNAGLGFDPSGQWLYAGTDRTVVEWDMRGVDKGHATWGIA